MSESLIVNTTITEQKVQATEAAYQCTIQQVAEQLAQQNRQRPWARRLRFGLNVAMMVLAVLLIYTVYLDIFVIGDYCLTHQPHYLLDTFALSLGGLVLMLLIIGFWQGDRLPAATTRKTVRFTSRLLTKQSFRDVKTEYFPFIARYTLSDRQVSYQRVLGDGENERIKTPWQRTIAGTLFVAHEHFVGIYPSTRRLFPNLLILVDAPARDALRDYLLDLSLTEITLVDPEST